MSCRTPTPTTPSPAATSPVPPPAARFEPLEPRTLLSLTIDLDYSFDTQGFFDDAARREVVEFAADYLGGLINDSLLAIIPGAGNSWSARFLHPGDGTEASVDNPTIPADTIRIYVGGRDLSGSQLGLGGAGGWTATGSTSFLQIIEGRGQSGAIGPESSRTDFATWGGSVAFNLDTNWHTELSSMALGAGQADLLSLALHEFAHVLGFADSTPSFINLVSGFSFTGPQATAEFNAPEFAFEGDTSGGDRWHRPQTLTSLSSEATSTPFQAITTTVSRTGTYNILSDQTIDATWDGVLLVYQRNFDPANPLANLIAINDDYTGALLGGTGAGYSGIEGLQLFAGRDYIIVTTGADNSQTGAYQLEIRRPHQPLLLDSGDRSHWRDGTFSRGQEAALDPTLTVGTRKLLTPLDFAGLADIGWEISQPRWPGLGAAVTLDVATGDGSAIRAASAGHPGLHRFTPGASGFIEIVADASAPVLLRLWDSAGRLVASSEQTSPGASLIAHSAVETYVLEVASEHSTTYELRFAATPAGQRLYFPEGFATTRTEEIVWLTNPGPDPVRYTLLMRYEDPALPRTHNTLADSATIAPGGQIRLDISRGGVFAADAITGQTILIDTPYALVLEATGQLAAMVERSDVFGGGRISTAESFTTTIDRTWTFTRAIKDPGAAHDFLVYYNPNDHDAIVTLTFFTSGVQMQIEQLVEAGRRGGLNLDREIDAPAGQSGVVITSAPAQSIHEGAHHGIVAALSHFHAQSRSGWLVHGNPGDLPTAGFLAAGSPGAEVTSQFFNPGAEAAVVELDNGSAPFFVMPGQIVERTHGSGILRYEVTSGLVAAQLIERQTVPLPTGALTAAASAGPLTVTRNHFFAGADLLSAGVSLATGGLTIINPHSEQGEVRIRFQLSGGGALAEVTLDVGPGQLRRLDFADVAELLTASGPFSVFLRSSAPVAAAMTIFDATSGLGWSTAGLAAGVIDPV